MNLLLLSSANTCSLTPAGRRIKNLNRRRASYRRDNWIRHHARLAFKVNSLEPRSSNASPSALVTRSFASIFAAIAPKSQGEKSAHFTPSPEQPDRRPRKPGSPPAPW